MKTLWGAKTHFSLGESIISPSDLINIAKKMGYERVCLADTMTISGIIEASQAAKKEGVELVTGCSLRIKFNSDYFTCKIWVKTEDDFTKLLNLLTNKVFIEKSVKYIEYRDFLEYVADSDVFITAGDAYGIASAAFATDSASETIVSDLVKLTDARRVSMELVAASVPAFVAQNNLAMSIADKFGLGCVLHNMPMYVSLDEAQAKDVMSCILGNRKITASTRRTPAWRKHAVISQSDIESEFSDSEVLRSKIFPHGLSLSVSDILEHSNALADSLEWRWKKLPISLPKIAADEYTELVKLSVSAFKERLSQEIFGFKPDPSDLPIYKERLKYELGVLKNMGFSGYFLLVSDLVNWSKSVGIIVGPGRGSVGGSLVAFLLGITDVDPIRFNLLFERFINPERIDLPDADLDFASERRHEVIQYLVAKYGEDSVAGISNYIGLESPSALREVGKAYDLPIKEYEVSKFMPKEHGQSVSLDDAVLIEPAIENYAAKYPAQFEVSKKLVGVMKTLGTHAAGVVVAGEPLVKRAVVQTRGEFPVINWDKRVVEDQGLVKIDILGLTNLDIIRKALDHIYDSTGKTIKVTDIPLNDTRVLDEFTAGRTVGVFQFESSGMQRLLRNMGKGGRLTFDDVAACTALYRPGPLDSGMPEEYALIKQGLKEPYYEHPAMEKCLSETFGVLIYQESVMALSRELCGFTMPQADALRKAIGKKDQDKLNAEAEKFIAGAVTHGGMTIERAEAIWENIATFGSYGFNKSHSVEYTIISFITMWLKIHYPLAFYAAALSVMKEDRLSSLVEDMKRFGISIRTPDVNLSDLDFKIDYVNRCLIVPLNRIKGLSSKTAQAVLDAREDGGLFKTIKDFEARVQKRSCNVRHRELIERVGGFGSCQEPNAPAYNHPSRQRDQMELLPGLFDQKVIIDRDIVWDEFTKKQIAELIIKPSRELSNALPPLPRCGKKPKMMVILDCPTWADEKAGRIMDADNADFIKEAMSEAGLNWSSDAYYTFCVKVPKFGRRLSNEEIEKWKPLLFKEIQIINPPIIVVLGSETFRVLCPDEKSSFSESAGKVLYRKDLDANVVVGISPGSVWMDGTKQATMNLAFEKATELLL